MMRCSRWPALAACLFALTLAGQAQADDAKARRALKQAMEQDYLETRFDKAEEKLRKAIEDCRKSKCSPEIMAQLHVALGSVLAGGKKELQDARDAFVEALAIDPDIEPDPDLSSAEVNFAFEQAKKKLRLGEDEDEPKKTTKKNKRDDKPAEQTCSDDGPCANGLSCDKGICTLAKPKEPEAQTRRNWLSISFSPDISLVSGDDVCSKEGQKAQHFVCARADGSRYKGTPTAGVANNVNTGFALGTMRLALGYDRLISESLSLGVRIGFAFNGAGEGGASFLPVHGEGRLTYWPMSGSLADSGVYPFLFVSGGVAQVDSRVEVEVLEDGEVCGADNPSDITSPCQNASSDGRIEDRKQTLSGYKQAGLGFGSLGLGLRFAPSARAALNLGVRTSVTFPSFSVVFSPEAALTLGF